MQVQGLRWPDEVGIGRHGCRAFELDRLWLRTEAWSGHGGYGQFCLGEPDLGSMFDLPAEPHLVSSRPREPIEKRWTRTP